MALESLRARDRRIAGRRRDTDEKPEAPAGKGALEAAIRSTFAGRSRLDAEAVFGRGKPKPKPAPKPQEDTGDDEA